jgi:hypothetical protein
MTIPKGKERRGETAHRHLQPKSLSWFKTIHFEGTAFHYQYARGRFLKVDVRGKACSTGLDTPPLPCWCMLPENTYSSITVTDLTSRGIARVLCSTEGRSKADWTNFAPPTENSLTLVVFC